MAKIVHYWSGQATHSFILKGKRIPAKGRTQCGLWVDAAHGTDVLFQGKLPRGVKRGLNPKGNCSKCKAKVKNWV